uniref:Uncharacterized protein n=1 Tax=Chelydra serpentina TaxID=8475 RepID=A0A8C3RZL1_CHESE
MLRTHSSNLAMSVSSSQGFTSSKMDDLAIRVARRSSLSLFDSSFSSSSSDPKRSMSSSSLLSVVAPVESSTSVSGWFVGAEVAEDREPHLHPVTVRKMKTYSKKETF